MYKTGSRGCPTLPVATGAITTLAVFQIVAPSASSSVDRRPDPVRVFASMSYGAQIAGYLWRGR